MEEQISIFDILQPSLIVSDTNVPEVNENGYIPSEKLVPVKWEAWKFSRNDWTLRGGEPYIIDAFLVILPGNRLYVKEWMTYPFMYECKTAIKTDKMYYSLREKIVERIKDNNDIQQTWKVDTLPPLENMWKYKDGEYSCKEYAEKILYRYGYNASR